MRFGKVRSDLTPEQVECIKERALEAWALDAAQDPHYAAETVRFLAETQPVEWWLEILTTDSDMWEELLGFNPLEEDPK